MARLLLVLCCLPSVGRAEEGEDARAKAVRLTSEGAAAYKAEEYAKAVEKFEAAYRLYPAAPLLLNISRADLKLSRCSEALHYAELFKAEATNISAASPDAPDAWIANLERACIEAEVDSAPPGATIWIDGQRQTAPGKTPWTGRLPVGKHKILLWRAGYQEQGTFLIVTPDSPAHLTLTLYPSTTAGPSGAVEVGAPSPPVEAPKPPPVVAEKPPAPAEKPPAAAATPPSVEANASRAPVQLFPAPVPRASESPAASPMKRPVLRHLGYGGIAVGAAALVTAVVLGSVVRSGVTAAGKAPTSRTPAEASAEVSSSDAEAAATDALFVVGGVCAAVGIPLAVVF
jgi:hypothetical protein